MYIYLCIYTYMYIKVLKHYVACTNLNDPITKSFGVTEIVCEIHK